MKKCFVVVVILFHFLANAQPGYLGHRFIIAPEIGYTWNLYNPYGPKSFFKIEKQYGAGLGFVAGTRLQMNMMVSFYTMKDLYSKTDSLTDNYAGLYSDKLKCTEVQLSGRLYMQHIFRQKTGSLAPVGKFFEFGGGVILADYSPGDNSYFDDYGRWNHAAPEYPVAKRNFAFLMAGLGAQHIYWDRLVIYSDIQVTIPAGQVGGEEKHMPADYPHYLYLRNLLRMHFGIGFLL